MTRRRWDRSLLRELSTVAGVSDRTIEANVLELMADVVPEVVE